MTNSKVQEEIDNFKGVLRESLENCKSSRIDKSLPEAVLLTFQSASPEARKALTVDNEAIPLLCQCVRYLLEQMEVLENDIQSDFKIDMSELESLDKKMKKKNIIDIETGVNESPEKRHTNNWTDSASPDTAEGRHLKAIQRTFVVISICVQHFVDVLAQILTYTSGKCLENIKLFIRENGIRLVFDIFNSFKMHSQLFEGVARTSSRFKVSTHRLKTMTMAAAKLLYDILNTGAKIVRTAFLKNQGLNELKQSLLYNFKEENLEIVLLLLGVLSLATSGEFSETNVKHTALINLLLHHFQSIFKKKDVSLVLLGPLLMSLRNLLLVTTQAYSLLHSMNVIPQFLQLIDYAHFHSKKSLKILTLGLLFDLQQMDPKLENLIISLIQSYTPMSADSLSVEPETDSSRWSKEYISPVMRAESNELGLDTDGDDTFNKPLPEIANNRVMEDSPMSSGIYDMYKSDYLELKGILKVLSKGGGFAPNLEENLETIYDKLREDEVIRGLFIVDRVYVDVLFDLLHGGNETVVDKIWAIIELLMSSENGVQDHCTKKSIFQLLYSNFEDFGSVVKKRVLSILQLLISQYPATRKESRDCGLLELLIDMCHSFRGVDLNASIISTSIQVIYSLISNNTQNQAIFLQKQGLIMVQKHFINFAKILRFSNTRSSVAPLTNPYPNVIDFSAIDENLQIFENLSIMICSLASRNELIQNDFKSLSFIDQTVEEMMGHIKTKLIDAKTVSVFRCFTNVLRSLLENNQANQQFFCEKQQVALIKSLLSQKNIHIKLKGLKLLFQVNLDFPAGREKYASKPFLELLLGVFECIDPYRAGDPAPTARSTSTVNPSNYSPQKSALPGSIEDGAKKQASVAGQEHPVTMEIRMEACLFALMSISSLCQGNRSAKDHVCELKGARTILGLISHRAFESHQMICFCLNTLIKDHPGNTQDIINQDGYSKICDIFDKEENEEVELRAFQLMNNLGNYSVQATVNKINDALQVISQNRPYYCNKDEFNFLNLSRSHYFFRYVTKEVLEMDEHLKRLNVLEIHARHHSLYNQSESIDLIPTLENAEKFLAVLNGIVYMQQERKVYYLKNYGFEHIISLLTIKEFNMNLLDCILSITKNMTVDKKKTVQERARKDGMFPVLTQYLCWLNHLVTTIRKDKVYVYDIVTHQVGEKDDIAPVARDQFGSSPFRFDDDFGFNTPATERKNGQDASQGKSTAPGTERVGRGKTPAKFDPGETYEDITLSSSQRNILNALKDKKIDLEDDEAAKGFEESQKFDFDETVEELTQLKVEIYSILDDLTVAHNYNSVALSNCKNLLTTLISDCLNVEYQNLRLKAGDVLLNVYQEPQLYEYLNKIGCKKVLILLAKSAGRQNPAIRDRAIKLLERDLPDKE